MRPRKRPATHLAYSKGRINRQVRYRETIWEECNAGKELVQPWVTRRTYLATRSFIDTYF
jgi:hypothetical protein